MSFIFKTHDNNKIMTVKDIVLYHMIHPDDGICDESDIEKLDVMDITTGDYR